MKSKLFLAQKRINKTSNLCIAECYDKFPDCRLNIELSIPVAGGEPSFAIYPTQDFVIGKPPRMAKKIKLVINSPAEKEDTTTDKLKSKIKDLKNDFKKNDISEEQDHSFKKNT